MGFFELFGKLVVENKDAIDSLKETSEEAEKTGESANKIGNGFKKNGEVTKSKLAEIAKNAGKTTDEVKSEAEELAKSYREAGMDSASAMNKAYEDIDASAKKSSDSAKKSGNNIKAVFSAVAKAGAAVAAAIVSIGTAMVGLAESTRSYRLEMGKLETAFTSAGHTAAEATATYQTLQSILGETERAVEASQHIAKLCETEEEMKAITEACIGAFALFDDSLPIEGLMEASNETAKTGQLTGVLTDALNWAGYSEEAFQEKLDACNTERERAALITETLIDLYADAAGAYKNNNKAIIEATEAQENLNVALARWGKLVEPWVTDFKNVWASIINTTVDGTIFSDFEEDLSDMMETADEAAEYVAALKNEIESEKDFLVNGATKISRPGVERRLSVLQGHLENATARYNELAAAEQNAADVATEAATATADAAEEFATITDQYVSDAQALFEKFATTYDGIYNRVAGWFDPFEKAKINVRTNVKDMMAAMQSQIDFNNSYTENLQTLKEYGLGSLSEAFQSYGAEGAAYAKAIVDAVEKAGGATTDKGQEIIQGFADINQQVAESQAELAQTTALLNGEFETELQSMNEAYEAAIDGLEKSSEARTAAVETFEGFLAGMKEKFPEIENQLNGYGKKITDALQSGFGEVKISFLPITFDGFIPKYETGLDYVPYDNYLAYLHQGEAVLTAEEARAWRAGKGYDGSSNNSDSGAGGVTVIQNIEAVAQTPVELASATAAYFEQARWVT